VYSGDGCSSTCQIEEGWECGQTGLACCRSLSTDMASAMGTMQCYDGFWVATDANGSMKRDFTTPGSAQITGDTSLCGQVTINGILEVVNGTLTIAGTLIIPDGSVLSFPAVDPYTHGQVVVVNACQAPGISGTNNGELHMASGSVIRIISMQWTNDDLMAGGHEFSNFVVVQNTADMAQATFRMEAAVIPDGSNTFPFITSGAQTVNDPQTPFSDVELDLDGGCSNIDLYHSSNGTWGYVQVTVNRKDLCESTIILLVVGLPLIAAALLLILLVISSGGAGGTEDYVGL